MKMKIFLSLMILVVIFISLNQSQVYAQSSQSNCTSFQVSTAGPPVLKKYEFEVNGSKSYAIIQGDPTSEIISFTLDNNTKKLEFIGNYKTVGGDSGRIPFDINFPSELLDGDLIIQNDQNGTILLSGAKSWDEINSPSVTYHDSNPPWNYWLSAHKYDCHTQVSYMWYKAGTHRLDITGTTAIPEFPFVVPILLASFVSVIVFYRMNF